MFERFRKRLFEILEFPIAGDWVTRLADLFIMGLIFLNVVVIIIETVPGVRHEWHMFFAAFDVFSVFAFSVEYVLRLWSCTADPRYARPILGRLRYAFTFMALVDLLAVLPFYLGLFLVARGAFDLRFLRVLRLARLFRIFKLARYMKSIGMIGEVVREKRGELVMTLVFSAMLLILSSSLMYFVEHEAQPKQFSSIPATMWWAMETLTTLGYGDVVPVTLLGRILGAIVALTGVGMFALPTAILGSGFIEVVRRDREKRRVCPHCGKLLDGPGA